MSKYLSLGDALALTDEMAVRVQVSLRGKLMSEMVGTLYPNIVLAEICELNGQASDLRREREDCIFVQAGGGPAAPQNKTKGDLS